MKSALVSSVACILVCVGYAVNVGIFDNTRLYGSTFNIKTGSQMTQFRIEWENRGAVWFQTSQLTAAFLSGVQVFITSKISSQLLSDAEKAALTSWVRSGGTLIVTAECDAHPNQPAYNSMLNLFGFTVSGRVTAGYGQTVGSHPLLGGLTNPYIAQNGILTLPNGAQLLIRDRNGTNCAAVLEVGSLVGLGRVLAIGDTDMFTDYYLSLEPENLRFTKNMANWALNTPNMIYGVMTPAHYVGTKTGIPVTLEVYQDGFLVDYQLTYIEDEAGSYRFQLLAPGTYDLRVKHGHWLSVLKRDVVVSGITRLDWDIPYNGDVYKDNVINASDLNLVLVDFAKSGNQAADANGSGTVDLPDINIVIVNFARSGE